MVWWKKAARYAYLIVFTPSFKDLGSSQKINNRYFWWMEDERLLKWRLILGKAVADELETEGLGAELQGMDDVLDALYDSDKQGGLGSSAPNVNRWLGDIRQYFPTNVVQVMQRDALERLGLNQMLTEPELLEAIEPDVQLVATLLTLKKAIPAKTKETARIVIRKVVEKIEKQLKNPLRQAITGSIHRAQRNRRPKFKEIDWHQTIRRNMKNYQPDLNTVIPEHLIGFGKRGQALKKVILLVDQSGSMASSIVYAGIAASVMASIRSIKTHLVVFDTAVVDLTPALADPVAVLFGTQLGGGTDINRAMQYAKTLVEQPQDTVLVLISDLYEGGNAAELVSTTALVKESGVNLITLLALSDQGAPLYDRMMAERFGRLGIPVFACTPDAFPDLMAKALRNN